MNTCIKASQSLLIIDKKSYGKKRFVSDLPKTLNHETMY